MDRQQTDGQTDRQTYVMKGFFVQYGIVVSRMFRLHVKLEIIYYYNSRYFKKGRKNVYMIFWYIII